MTKVIEVSAKMVISHNEEMTDKDLDSLRRAIESDLCNRFALFDTIDVTVEEH